MSQVLPPQANLEHLKSQAKDLLSAAQAGDAALLAEIGEPNLANAQFAIAKRYGFPSWPRLKKFVEGQGPREAFIQAAIGGQLDTALALADQLSDDPVFAAMTGRLDVLTDTFQEHYGARSLLNYLTESRFLLDSRFEAGILACAKFLLEKGADPNATYENQYGPMSCLYHAAGVLNHVGLTKMLLDAGARTDDNESVYHASEHPGRNECLRLLFKAGVTQSDLDYCIKRKLDYEDLDGLQAYLDAGVNLNVANINTALSHAILRGRSITTINFLLDHGSDPNMEDQDGTTPYSLARRLGQHETAQLLLDRGANRVLRPFDEVAIAAVEGNEPALDRVLQENPGLIEASLQQFRDELTAGKTYQTSGVNCLHDFARLGNARALRMLIRAGFPAGLPNQWNETPLHWACLAGQPECAKILLDAGAPLDGEDINHHGNPFGWACWGSVYHAEPGSDHLGVVKLLLQAGAPKPDTAFGSPAILNLLRNPK